MGFLKHTKFTDKILTIFSKYTDISHIHISDNVGDIEVKYLMNFIGCYNDKKKKIYIIKQNKNDVFYILKNYDNLYRLIKPGRYYRNIDNEYYYIEYRFLELLDERLKKIYNYPDIDDLLVLNQDKYDDIIDDYIKKYPLEYSEELISKASDKIKQKYKYLSSAKSFDII